MGSTDSRICCGSMFSTKLKSYVKNTDLRHSLLFFVSDPRPSLHPRQLPSLKHHTHDIVLSSSREVFESNLIKHLEAIRRQAVRCASQNWAKRTSSYVMQCGTVYRGPVFKHITRYARQMVANLSTEYFLIFILDKHDSQLCLM